MHNKFKKSVSTFQGYRSDWLVLENIITSSREMSSLLNVRPGMSPLFFNQKMAAKLPLKKMPSTAAKAMTRSAKVALSLAIQLRAQLAFFATHGSVSMALNKNCLVNFQNKNFRMSNFNNYRNTEEMQDLKRDCIVLPV